MNWLIWKCTAIGWRKHFGQIGINVSSRSFLTSQINELLFFVILLLLIKGWEPRDYTRNQFPYHLFNRITIWRGNKDACNLICLRVCLSVCVCGIEVSVTMTTLNFSLKKVQDVGAQTSVGLSKWFRLFPDLVVVCVCVWTLKTLREAKMTCQ